MSKGERLVRTLAARYQLDIVEGGRHLKLTHPALGVVAVMPRGSMSEHGTALRKTEAQIRRALRSS